MKRIKVLLLLVLLLIPFKINAANKIDLYLFYGDGCPHCAEEEEFLNEYLKENDFVTLNKYEIWHSKENQELFIKVQEKLNNHNNGVPYLVIGDKVLIGYIDGTTDKRIEKIISNYKNDKKYENKIKKIIKGEEIEEVDPTKEEIDEVNLPILGKINTKEVSLPLLSVVLGFVDGFNPCAMWILIFLITMLINEKNRKKMWVLGLTFILTSGLVYLAFMLTWLNLASFISKLLFVRILVAFIAFIVGFINLNKYYQSRKKDDGCDVVNKKDRKKIMEKIMNVVKEKSFIIAIGGIMVLAASVNIIEMMCSIGLPLIFTQILAMNQLSVASYSLYLFLYILFFLIDDIVIFVIAMISFKVTGISTKYTKYSHLVAGILLLLIGLIMLIKPSLLMFNY